MEYYINEEVAHEEGRMIRSLCPYDGRHLLVGTMEGIYLFDTARKNYRAFHSGFSHLYCTDIKRDPHGAFWCSTRQGLYKIQGNRVAAGSTRRRCRVSRPKRSVSAFPFPMVASWFVWI